MQLSTGYEERKARIEIVPLIDVVFLLLVFFIYAMLSMTVYRGLRIDLPAGTGLVEENKTLIITIAKDNTLWVDDQCKELPEVISLASGRAEGKDLPVLVSGDSGSDLGVAIELISGLRDANIQSVSFQVNRQTQNPTTGQE